MALLEAILEGLASPGSGGGLRDLCAEATQEFLVGWRCFKTQHVLFQHMKILKI